MTRRALLQLALFVTPLARLVGYERCPFCRRRGTPPSAFTRRHIIQLTGLDEGAYLVALDRPTPENDPVGRFRGI